MGVKLATASGGSIELVPTNTASTYTLTVPAVTASVLTDSSGVLDIGSGQIYKDASGNVGIGTSSPNYKVTLNGGGSASVLQMCNTASGTTANDGFLIYQDGSDCRLQNTEAGNMLFYTGNTERARIDSSGNLLVGVSSWSDGGGGSFIGNRAASGVNGKFSCSSTSNQVIFYFTNPNGVVGLIQASGSTTSYVTSSDYRLKENVQPMQGALEKVAMLKPCTYTWKADGSAGQGFIAHELQAVVPDAVAGEKDDVNEDGSIKPQGIDTSFLVATLTASIQELKTIVDEQAAKITALENK
jgi:hypothetical protein